MRSTTMKDDFIMRSLLEKAGFVIRSATRADCARCEGHSRATVSYTPQVAFCHRCKWTAHIVMLARELGLLQENPHAISAFRKDRRRRTEIDTKINCFDSWREARIREISDRFRSLSRAAALADNVLTKFLDSEEAWDALARFYRAEAQLSAAFDWLMFTKASVWLETDSSPVEVFESWRSYAA